MMDMILGETTEFWIRVRAAMRKARIDTPAELEDRLRVTPPTYEVVDDGDRWKIVERRASFDGGVVIGWGATKEDAERIVVSVRQREAA